LKSVTPFGSRQFSPPADWGEVEPTNQSEMTKEQIKIEVDHIFKSGANEVRVMELIEKVLSQEPIAIRKITPIPCPKCAGVGRVDGWDEIGSTTSEVCPVCIGHRVLNETTYFQNH